MNKKEVYKLGYDRGFNIANLQNMPQIGTKVETEDFTGIIEDKFDIETVFYPLCYEAETIDRDYTPFEFTAKKLNDSDETADFEVWDEFEKGITDGIKENFKRRIIFPAKE